MSSYRDLLVYQRSYDLALSVHKFSLTLPKNLQLDLGDQIRRATSRSIPANIAEGHGKSALSQKEFRRFLFMALGSCDEVRVYFDFLHDLGHIKNHHYEIFTEKYTEVGKMLQGLIKSIAAKTSNKKLESSN